MWKFKNFLTTMILLDVDLTTQNVIVNIIQVALVRKFIFQFY